MIATSRRLSWPAPRINGHQTATALRCGFCGQRGGSTLEVLREYRVRYESWYEIAKHRLFFDVRRRRNRPMTVRASFGLPETVRGDCDTATSTRTRTVRSCVRCWRTYVIYRGERQTSVDAIQSDDQAISHCSDLFPHMWDAVCSARRSSIISTP